MHNQLKWTAFGLSLFILPPAGFAEVWHDTVYTLTNDAGANEVLAFKVNHTGEIGDSVSFATGGTGTGQGLGNQGALALSPNGRFLFAVNAGSNDLSVFRLAGDKLKLSDRQPDAGVTPVSVAAGHDWVYVVNSGDDSIFGYQFNEVSGKLTPIANSYRKLSSGSGAAEIRFNRDEDVLVVTEKAVNKITSFTLDANGLPLSSHVINSAGVTPYGFAFGNHNQFFVAEADGGAANAATVSAYQLLADGSIDVVDGALATGKTAACWLATTPNGKWAFTADTPANTISSFAIDGAGNLKLVQSSAALENHPTDLAVGVSESELYVLSGGDHTIAVYGINYAGALTKKFSVSGLPAGTTGLVAR